MPVINDYQTRIIYSFTTDYDKILEYKNKTDFDIELIDKYLEYYKHIVI